jgi:undecaprenyl-diphosphatase
MRAQLPARARPARTDAAASRPRPVGGAQVVALRLGGGLIAVWALISLAGLLLTHLPAGGLVHHADLGVDRWLAARRSPAWNDVTLVGTNLAQTETAIGVAAVVVLLLRWRLGRWYESLVLITVMAGELAVFFAVTATIQRQRPPVARLDMAPPTSSFPSGHTAAAIALYGAIALLLRWLYGRRPAIQAATVLLFCVPVFVALARLYRGMHYPSDVLAGALAGGLWLALVMSTLLPRRRGDSRRAIRPQR